MTHASSSPESTLRFQDDEDFGYGQLFRILLRRWPWIVGTLGLSIAAAILLASREKPSYLSSMQLIVEPNFEEQLSPSDLNPSNDRRVNEIDYATQLNLMRSEQFVAQAITRLQSEYPMLTVEQVQTGFRLNRVVENDTETRIFKASYIAGDPVLTQRFLEELRAVYLEYNENKQQQRLNRGLDHINEQLMSTRDSLRQSQAALQTFRQNASLIDPSAQAQKAVEALDRIQSEERQLQADFAETQAQYQALEQQLKISPNAALLASRLSQSKHVQDLLNELQTTELDLAKRRAVFTDADPTVQLLLEQRQSQRQLLQETISTIIRQPVSDLDSSLLSYLQLGSVDLSLVSDLLANNAKLKSLTARQARLSQQETQLRQQLNSYPTLIAEYDRLQPEVDIERETLQRLLEEREQVTSELSRGGYTWQVIEEPAAGIPFGPNPLKKIVLAIVVGLFLGGLLAFAREAMDTVVRTSEDLKKKVPLPLLGILPMPIARRGFNLLPTWRESTQSSQVHPELAESSLIQPILNPMFRESMDVIGNLLQLRQTQNVCKALTVTSGLPEEGKTTVTLGLAYSLARMSQQVLIIDADLRRSGLRSELGLANGQNLSTFLIDGIEPTVFQKLDLGPVQIDILPAGPIPSDPLLLLSSPRFKRLVFRCRELYDVVLIDTPPVLGMADATKVGAVCDGIVLVTRLDRITQAELSEVVALLTPFNVLGLIANGGKSPSLRYGDYSDRSYASSRTTI